MTGCCMRRVGIGLDWIGVELVFFGCTVCTYTCGQDEMRSLCVYSGLTSVICTMGGKVLVVFCFSSVASCRNGGEGCLREIGELHCSVFMWYLRVVHSFVGVGGLLSTSHDAFSGVILFRPLWFRLV